MHVAVGSPTLVMVLLDDDNFCSYELFLSTCKVNSPCLVSIGLLFFLLTCAVDWMTNGTKTSRACAEFLVWRFCHYDFNKSPLLSFFCFYRIIIGCAQIALMMTIDNGR